MPKEHSYLGKPSRRLRGSHSRTGWKIKTTGGRERLSLTMLIKEAH